MIEFIKNILPIWIIENFRYSNIWRLLQNYRNPIGSRLKEEEIRLLTQFKIDVIFDIGANIGQYARETLSYGYTNKMVSFEPLPAAFKIIEKQLVRHGSGDWYALNLALGNYNGNIEFNVSEKSESSSVLPMMALHIDSSPQSGYIDQITVPVRRLDSIINEFCSPDNRLFVKMDVQGYENIVLEGCSLVMDRIVGFQMELSLKPLYEGETLMVRMIEILDDLGYGLFLIKPGLKSKLGELLQADCIFFRQNAFNV